MRPSSGSRRRTCTRCRTTACWRRRSCPRSRSTTKRCGTWPASRQRGRRAAMSRKTITMPQLGESVVEGTVGAWLKSVGEEVKRFEPLVEVITDKVNTEIPSEYGGILREILVEEGATVSVGT